MTVSNDPLRTYFQLASGITEATLAKAKDAAKALLNDLDLSTLQNQSKTRINDLAEDVMEQGKANRDALTAMIRTEVDKAVGRLGFVREEELAALRAHVMRLEAQLAKSGTPSAKTPTSTTAAPKKPTKSAAKKSAKKTGSAPRKSAAKKAV